MPTYAYACTACEHRFEIVQSFTDDSLTECPECAGRLRKLFNAVGVVFKGSGFYSNDSRRDSADSHRESGKGSRLGHAGNGSTGGNGHSGDSAKNDHGGSGSTSAPAASGESGGSTGAGSAGKTGTTTSAAKSGSKSEGAAA